MKRAIYGLLGVYYTRWLLSDLLSRPRTNSHLLSKSKEVSLIEFQKHIQMNYGVLSKPCCNRIKIREYQLTNL